VSDAKDAVVAVIIAAALFVGLVMLFAAIFD
jgi:hypothetical protein